MANLIEEPEQTPSDFLDQLYSRKQEFLTQDRYRNIADATSFFTKVVGVSFEGRQGVVGGLRVGDQLQLVREPENCYDPHAVAVRFGALGIGYLRRDIAAHLAPHIDAGRRYQIEIASLTGGGTERSLGVNVLVKRADLVSVLQTYESPSASAYGLEEIQRLFIGNRQLHRAQTEVIERVLAGKNTLAVLGTGRGKSLCFQLPAAVFALHSRKKTLVLYPLRALANDQYEALQRRLGPCGLRVVQANGALDAAGRAMLDQALETGEWDLLLTTPEFMQFHSQRFANEANRPAFMVVDESHHIYESTHRPAYKQLGKILQVLQQPIVLALTATARAACFDEIVRTLAIEAWVIDPAVRENLEVVHARGTKDRLAYLRRELEGTGKAIIYCNSRNEATKVAELLRVNFPATAFYHAGVPSPERLEIEARFRAGEIRIIVATSAFGEGIDLPDVRDVVLYHLNFSFTEFNQQAGRAGRDGQAARIHLLYGEPDRRINDFIIAKSSPTIAVLREVYRGLRGLADERGELRMAYTEIARTLELERADETTISVAVKIFADAGLLDLIHDDDGRLIRFMLPPPKVDLTQTVRFAEAEADRETFNRFCHIAMEAQAIDLQRIINRPIYPDGVPLVR